MNSTPITWQYTERNTRECPVCGFVITKEESSLHAGNHSEQIVERRSITPVYDTAFFNQPISILYICSYCNAMPPPRTGRNQVDDIYRHLESECPLRKSNDIKSFKIISDPKLIEDIIAAMRDPAPIDLWICRNDNQAFGSKEKALAYFQRNNLTSPSRNIIREKYQKGLVSEDVRTLLQDLSEDEPKAAISGKPSERSSTLIPKKLGVPHPRSILKSLAGIDEEIPPRSKDVDEGGEEISDPPQLGPKGTPESPKFVKKELRYTNILYGHINLTSDVESLIDTSKASATLVTEEGRKFIAAIEREKGLLYVGGDLSDWFEENQIVAGCYIYLQLTEDRSGIEISYVPTGTVIKKCLFASWDETHKRVVLRYEDTSVNVECSEHLFRNSVNLDDFRVLDYMARLHGSIFDVLYLGMRDLANAGHEIVHYRDLHNMVIDKRLHPQLGSVLVELSKNELCFGKLGGGFWHFIADPRIEKILPNILDVHDHDKSDIKKEIEYRRVAANTGATLVTETPEENTKEPFESNEVPTLPAVEDTPSFDVKTISQTPTTNLRVSDPSEQTRRKNLVQSIRIFIATVVEFLKRVLFSKS